MRIKLKPQSSFVPGKGTLTINEIEVAVSLYELGGKIRGSYEVFQVTQAPAEPGKEAPKPKQVSAGSGTADLTPEQAAQWGADDTFFCRCIAQNVGLTPE